MQAEMKAIQVTGTVDENHQLKLDDELPIAGPAQVKVIILYQPDEIAEREWLRASSHNPVFQSLKKSSQDIYTATDGKPINDKIQDCACAFSIR